MKETESERTERVEMELKMRDVVTAREAIVALIGKYKRHVSVSVSGRMNCPVCGSEESLHYRRAAMNGHISAACTTKGCVNWVE